MEREVGIGLESTVLDCTAVCTDVAQKELQMHRDRDGTQPPESVSSLLKDEVQSVNLQEEDRRVNKKAESKYTLTILRPGAVTQSQIQTELNSLFKNTPNLSIEVLLSFFNLDLLYLEMFFFF